MGSMKHFVKKCREELIDCFVVGLLLGYFPPVLTFNLLVLHVISFFCLIIVEYTEQLCSLFLLMPYHPHSHFLILMAKQGWRHHFKIILKCRPDLDWGCSVIVPPTCTLSGAKKPSKGVLTLKGMGEQEHAVHTAFLYHFKIASVLW